MNTKVSGKHLREGRESIAVQSQFQLSFHYACAHYAEPE